MTPTRGASRSMSIRARLSFAIAAVLIVTLVIAGTVLVGSTRDTLVQNVDEELLEFANRAHGRLPSSGWFGNGPNRENYDLIEWPYAQLVYSPTGELLREELSGFSDEPHPPPDVPPVSSDALDALVGRVVTLPAVEGSLEYRALVQREPDRTVNVIAAPLDEVDAAVESLVNRLLVIGALALIVAIVACWFLIRRGLRPVDRMVDTATVIAAGDLSRRVQDSDPGTELGRLGQALNEMLHQIERAMEARAASENRLRQFVADAAHELRTPLTSLRGYAELYRQGALPDSESVAGAMERIEAEGARMARLVDDLLLLARLDQQRGVERERIEINDVVDDAVSAFRAANPDWPITQSLDGPVTICGDRLRLRQVFDNLLANVRAHTPTGTPAHVAQTHDACEVAVSISDEGPGIAPEYRERMFDRFWRGGDPRLRSHGGTGLGLAIVASLIEAHGGSIDVASEPGQGTTFTVRLPLAAHTDDR